MIKIRDGLTEATLAVCWLENKSSRNIFTASNLKFQKILEIKEEYFFQNYLKRNNLLAVWLAQRLAALATSYRSL